jgi:hypothetical protein
MVKKESEKRSSRGPVAMGIAATSRAANHDDSASSCFIPLLCRPKRRYS